MLTMQKYKTPEKRLPSISMFKMLQKETTHECQTNNEGNSRENLINVAEYIHLINVDDYDYDYDPDGNIDRER